MITALLIGAGALWLISRKQKAIGKVERIKRRIYKEVSMAQGEGVDFSKKFDELTAAEIDALQAVGNEVAWKQSKRSIESGKSYAEAYFNSLRRAWNAVSGVQGIGRAWNVKDANGNTVLTWIEDAAHHVEAEAVPVTPKKPRSRRAATAPAAHKSKQQQILDRFPYLKIMDDPSNPIPASEQPFSIVLWKIVKNNQGEKSYEGAAMAFTNRTAAESAKAYMKREPKGIIHPAWQDFYEEMREQYDRHYQSYGAWFNTKDHDTQYLVKDVSKINVDKISGIGGERFDARYISDRSGNWYVTLDESWLPEMKRRGASEYDLLVAQNQLDSCGRIIVYIEDWLQPLDNEFYLEEVYYIVDKMREAGEL